MNSTETKHSQKVLGNKLSVRLLSCYFDEKDGHVCLTPTDMQYRFCVFTQSRSKMCSHSSNLNQINHTIASYT